MQLKEKVMPEKVDLQESFRSSLEDLVLVANKLLTFCEKTSDLIGMLNLALENEGQLKLLMNLVTAQQQGNKR